jgi:DNA-directed RNA polymerase subunit RPC12/RpoP
MSVYVCRKCAVEMRVERNGVILTPMNVMGEAMEIRRADLWKCPDCGYEVVPVPSNNVPEAFWSDNLFASKLFVYRNDGSTVVIPYWLNLRERELAATKASAASTAG